MTRLTKQEAITAIETSDGALTQSALIEAGLHSSEVVFLGRVLERLGCAERGSHNRRALIVPLDEAADAIRELNSDPLELPTEAVLRPYEIVYVPDRSEAAGLQPGDRLAHSDILADGCGRYDGVELTKNGLYYRAYQSNLYVLQGGFIGEAGFVVDATMVRVDP